MEGAYADQSPRGKLYPKVAEKGAEYQLMSPAARAAKIVELEKQMYEHAHNLEFEKAAELRDEIKKIERNSVGL